MQTCDYLKLHRGEGCCHRNGRLHGTVPWCQLLGPRDRSGCKGFFCLLFCYSPQISAAVETIRESLSHCCCSVMSLPSSVEENPHWVDRQSWSRSAYLAASSMRRLMKSLGSSSPRLLVTTPSTTRLPLGR